jgi:hypothetical protein
MKTFTTREIEAMLAFAGGFSEGENNRWYLNEYEPAEQEHTAFDLGYEAGKQSRGIT